MQIESTVRAESTRTLGAANAEAETARLASYAGIDPAVLTALAMQSLAENLPSIGTLNLTPDILTEALTRIAAVPAAAASAPSSEK